MKYDFKPFQTRLGEIKDWLQKELSSIRTGRASAILLDNVKVNSYGSQMPIDQVASVVSEDAKTLRITPYDVSQIKEIEKAITDADLGTSLIVDEKGVRVIFPELTSERREILIKQVSRKLEESRVSIRSERDDIWGDIQKKEKDGDISEDEKYSSKEEMQKYVDDTQKELDTLAKTKEEELQL